MIFHCQINVFHWFSLVSLVRTYCSAAAMLTPALPSIPARSLDLVEACGGLSVTSGGPGACTFGAVKSKAHL